jgi:membrane protease YdiL (CAAX protease family)
MPRTRDNWGDLPSSRLGTKWTVRYVIGAYLVTWLVVAAVSVGGLIPSGLGAITIDASWLLALVPIWRSGNLNASAFGLRRPRRPGSALLTVGVVFAYGVVALIWDEIANVTYVSNPFGRLSHEGIVAIALGAISALLSPIAEELFFRGFAYRALRYRLAAPAASVWVGLMFGIIHTQYSLAVLPELVVLGIMLCLLYEYSGSLIPGVLIATYLDVGGYLSALLGNGIWSLATLGFILLLIVMQFSRESAP